MSPEAWAEFWNVTIDLLCDMVVMVGFGMWLGWDLRGRHDRKRQGER